MNKISLFLSGLAIVLMTGCTAESVNSDDPKSVLIHYFELLVKEDYDGMVHLYGGSYERLQGYLPHVDPNDKARLFHDWVHITGGQIVRVHEIISEEEISPGKFKFRIVFERPDGTIFRDGLVYDYIVEKMDGKYKVMDVPPMLA